MTSTSTDSVKALSYKAICARAWPIILANASVPLLGLADTAIIGHISNTQALGALALGSLIFSFLYWSFGFLRMGTTGFIAQASGQKNETEVRASLFRALLIAVVLGVVILILQYPINYAAFSTLDASTEIESYAKTYFNIRIWGAPATLMSFALFGTLIGLGKSKTLLVLQLVLNGSNILLDYYFSAYLNLGIKGIAWGTIIAEWATCLLALSILYQQLKNRQRSLQDNTPFIPHKNLFHTTTIFTTLQTNSDIMIRTLFILVGFVWFNNQSAKLGDSFLAANHILLQFISFSAFFLDGFAFVVESYIGKAVGEKNRSALKTIIKKTTHLACLTAIFLTFFILIFGGLAIQSLTSIETLQIITQEYLLYCALYVALAFPAFQLDGIFIGALRGKEMRNASVFSTTIFIGICIPATSLFDNDGLWISFIIYVCTRALSLLYYYPTITNTLVGRS